MAALQAQLDQALALNRWVGRRWEAGGRRNAGCAEGVDVRGLRCVKQQRNNFATWQTGVQRRSEEDKTGMERNSCAAAVSRIAALHAPAPPHAATCVASRRTIDRAQQRQAVVAAGAAADGPSAELHRLRAELDAASGQLQRAEADLAAQQAAAAARLGEMQVGVGACMPGRVRIFASGCA